MANAKQKLRDEALHLYGDIFRVALLQRQLSGPAAIRLELFDLSKQLNTLVESYENIDVHRLYKEIIKIERRFKYLRLSLPTRTTSSQSLYRHTAQDKLNWLTEHREQEEHLRSEMHRAAQNLRELYGARMPDNPDWVVAVNDAKERLKDYSAQLSVLDNKSLAVSFLGSEIVENNME